MEKFAGLVAIISLLSIPHSAFAWTCQQECPESVFEGVIECEAYQVLCDTANGGCAIPFATYTGSVFGVCVLDHGSSGSGNINAAIDILVRNCLYPREAFNGVDFYWCTPLKVGADGMVPNPENILLSRDYRNATADVLAPLISHEMVHILQVRALGFHRFACQYSGEILSGKGTSCPTRNSADGNFLECAAYRKGDETRANIRPENNIDTDMDGLGDLCDPDSDNDAIANTLDNCRLVRNSDQGDNDLDGSGDLCDADNDNDKIDNEKDNCPLVANADQNNNDADAFGDLCDYDDDNDGITDSSDNCSQISNAYQENHDHDSMGDACDSDDDNDTIADGDDNCRHKENKDQTDGDHDGIGDVCDNCRMALNATQSDGDCDGVGDACDDLFLPSPSCLGINVRAVDKRLEPIRKLDWPIWSIDPKGGILHRRGLQGR